MNRPKLNPRTQTNPTTGSDKVMPISIDERIEFYNLKLAELAQEKEEREAELLEELSLPISELERMGYVISKPQNSPDHAGAGLRQAQAQEPVIEVKEELEASPWWQIDSQKGLFGLLGVFAVAVLFFAWYGFFVPLNDSEARITNAALLHFVSHIWMSVAVLLIGFGFQFLAFNDHFRYLWDNCYTEESAKQDFWTPSHEGKVRLLTALATWAFPVYIITQMFQLILG